MRKSSLLAWITLLLLARLLASTAYRSATSTPSQMGWDFKIFYSAAQDYDHTHSFYSGDHYVYSPLVALALRPLAHLPYEKAAEIWIAAEIALALLSVILFCWALDLNVERDVVLIALSLITLFRCWPTTIEFAAGNVNVLVMALVCALYVANRYQKFNLFAVLLAFTGLVKTWTLGFGLYLLLRRQFKSAVLAGAIYFAGLAILFTLCGWHQFAQFINATRQFAFQPEPYSLPGFAKWFLSDSARNVIHMQPFTTNKLIYDAFLAGGFLILIVGLFIAFARNEKDDLPRTQLKLGFVILTILLALTVVHNAYFLFVFPLLWTLLLIPAPKCKQCLLILAAMCVYVVWSIPNRNPADPYQFGIKRLLMGTLFTAACLLWAAALWAIASGKEARTTE
jgi:hypothetical protein